MKLNQLLDIELLNKHRAAGFVGVQLHPTLPLRIYNYTHLAQYDGKAWGDGTIDYCRGLIVDDQDEIIARPFKKFHNLNTASIPETCEENLPVYEPIISAKLDGSLGIYYWYDGVEGIATRGSFTSPQAIWATNWYKERGKNFRGIDQYDRMEWPLGTTPLFEIIYPENRIVVKYDFAGLILIGLVDIEQGFEWDRGRTEEVANHNQIDTVKRLANMSLEYVKALNVPNEEGFVFTYLKRDEPPLKIKIKMADYVRLHRVITGMNAHTLWEIFKCGGPFDRSDFPDHVQRWVQSWSDKLHTEYFFLQKDAYAIYNNRPAGDSTMPLRDYRKLAAEYFFRQNRPELKSLFFLMMDGKFKDVSAAVWDMIEPRGDDRSFQSLDTEEISA